MGLGGAGMAGMGMSGMGSGSPSQTVTYDTVPAGEVEIRRGEHVHATDGHIGRVQGLVIDRQSRHVTHPLLQEGHVRGRKDVAIPVSAVASTSDGIQLSISKQEVQDLPPVDVDHPYTGTGGHAAAASPGAVAMGVTDVPGNASTPQLLAVATAGPGGPATRGSRSPRGVACASPTTCGRNAATRPGRRTMPASQALQPSKPGSGRRNLVMAVRTVVLIRCKARQRSSP